MGRVFGRALFDRERVPAAARRGRVRVVDLEPGLGEAVQEVDRGALQVRGAVGVDHDGDAVLLDPFVVIGGAGVEPEPVLETGAAAALDRDTQDLASALRILGHQLADLVRCSGGEGDEGRGAFDGCHERIVARHSEGARTPTL